jgi:hypothetical protein
VEEIARFPRHSDMGHSAPSHYGMLAITREMASSPFLDPGLNVACVIGNVAGQPERIAYEETSKFRSLS